MGLINKEFKIKYNTLISREKKAEQWLENPSRRIEEIKKWLPEFNKITINLSKMMNEYKKITGEEMPDDLVLNGFNI